MAPKPSGKSLVGKKASKLSKASKSKPEAIAGNGIRKGVTASRHLSSPQSNDTSRGRNGIRKPANRFPKAKFYATRKRIRKHCSMASVLGNSLNSDEVPVDHGSKFGEGSTARLTWGIVSDQPVSAISKQRRHGGFRELGLRRGKRSAFEPLMFMPYLQDDDENIKTSLILAIPLEVRQNIYEFLLVHKLPIILDCNWQNVRSTATLDLTILTVNKQVLQEGTQFLFEKNVFQALVEHSSYSMSSPIIEAKFLPHLRNVVIEFPRQQWTGNDLDVMVHSINILIQKNTSLDSLTTIISPQRIGIPAVNAGFDDDAITFANFFEAPASKLMRRITKLRCKTWYIVVRLSKTKRVLISIDMTGTTGNQSDGGWFADDIITKRIGCKKTKMVKDELLGLKAKIEQIFEDNERAVIEAMEEEIELPHEDSAKGPKELVQQASFKTLPIQLRNKWDDEKEKIRTDELRFKSLAEKVWKGFSEEIGIPV